jgi:LysR family transcriptional regulator, nitrogen assimilation regulatory protein
MHLEPLKYFLRAAELNSLTKAASMLGITQPVMSRSIAQLERELGGRLFHRTGHGVQLTPLGESLLGRAQRIIEEVEALLGEARLFSKTPSGEVRVGMPPSFSVAVVSVLLDRARQQLPNVKVKIFVASTARLDDWLDEGRIDIVLNFGSGRSMGNTQLIGTVDTYLVGTRGSFLAQRRTVDFKELHDLPLILPATKNGLRKVIDDLAAELDIQLSPAVEVDTSALYLKLVKEGQGYAITTLHALSRENADGQLVAALIVKPRVARKIMLGTSLRMAPSLATLRLTALIADISKPLLKVSPAGGVGGGAGDADSA